MEPGFPWLWCPSTKLWACLESLDPGGLASPSAEQLLPAPSLSPLPGWGQEWHLGACVQVTLCSPGNPRLPEQ